MSRRSVKGPKRLIPGAAGNTDAILEDTGWGDVTLGEARQSGMVKPVPIGRDNWYSHDELLAWLKWKKEQKQRRSA